MVDTEGIVKRFQKEWQFMGEERMKDRLEMTIHEEMVLCTKGHRINRMDVITITMGIEADGAYCFHCVAEYLAEFCGTVTDTETS